MQSSFPLFQVFVLTISNINTSHWFMLHCIHIAFIIGDTPYGITHEDWDKVWSKKDLSTILKQIAAQNTSTTFAIFFWHTPVQTQMFVETLTEEKYQDITHLYWHKTDHHVSGTPVSQFTSSVEMGTLAFFPSRLQHTVNLNLNPRLRHNFIDLPILTKKYKDQSGVVVNPCQKPPALAAWMIGSLCMPGSTVLVIGAGGGGGEVVGALCKGCSVVAVENNEYQYEQLQRHLLIVKENIIAEQISCDDQLSEPVQEEDSIPESQSFSAGCQFDMSSQSSDSTKKCGLCGKPFLDNETGVKCYDQSRCLDLLFHDACCSMFEDTTCCNDCATDREKVAKLASEAETQVPEQ